MRIALELIEEARDMEKYEYSIVVLLLLNTPGTITGMFTTKKRKN
jgi:hypothetical protein